MQKALIFLGPGINETEAHVFKGLSRAIQSLPLLSNDTPLENIIRRQVGRSRFVIGTRPAQYGGGTVYTVQRLTDNQHNTPLASVFLKPRVRLTLPLTHKKAPKKAGGRFGDKI